MKNFFFILILVLGLAVHVNANNSMLEKIDSMIENGTKIERIILFVDIKKLIRNPREREQFPKLHFGNIKLSALAFIEDGNHERISFSSKASDLYSIKIMFYPSGMTVVQLVLLGSKKTIFYDGNNKEDVKILEKNIYFGKFEVSE